MRGFDHFGGGAELGMELGGVGVGMGRSFGRGWLERGLRDGRMCFKHF